MEEKRGMNRGSFLWGRSIHNIRIERLWVDVTQGFGGKWKEFFGLLEVYCGLDAADEGHLWLLHFVFLEKIRRDAELWRTIWNQHRMRLPEGGRSSPAQMWFFGQVKHGSRGIDDAALWMDQQQAQEAIRPVDSAEHSQDDALYQLSEHEGGGAMYGVDWIDMEDPRLLSHRSTSRPLNMPYVAVEPPDCPLKGDQEGWLSSLLSAEKDVNDREGMADVWEKALDAYNAFLDVSQQQGAQT
ncbi:hypothetical protein CALCODRAFT_431113 [Calocera cornea HHB12733]|uniref:Integrase core domain-containing protein n=1 Tax=Calocera cornea HHB12733 TaxID=1353952 RepID=A0A165HJ75_9BASI|nr:hypothetical protein CALCODRAFT_431113 [Calocera cornea HHB12733]